MNFLLKTCGAVISQGLGKTVSMIALIQMQRSLESKYKSDQFSHKTEALNLDDDDNGSIAPDKGKQTGESDDLKVIPEATTIPEFRRRRPAAGTLVVCPASVLRQWARELDEKVADEAKFSVIERAEEVLANVADGFPSFFKCMLPSNVTHGFWLVNPKFYSVF